jgi:HAMP domain-containing protein
MKLQSKLLGSILVVAVLPLLILCALFYSSYRHDLSRTVKEHLQSVASIQQSRLSAILLQNEERLALVASRTQLRLSMDRYLQTGDSAALQRMTRILQDAVSSIEDLEAISVYSPQGVVVASTDSALVGQRHFDQDLFLASLKASVVDRLFLDEQGESRVHLCGPMTLDGRTLGALVIRSRVGNLLSSIFDYAGLGQSGETILVRPTGKGGHQFLAPTRFDATAAMTEFSWDGNTGGGNVALQGGTQNSAIDYRGIRVLTAAREVPGTGWILVVKIDQAEALRGLDRTAFLAAALAGILMISISLTAFRMARGLSAPLVELSAAAGAIAQGDFSRSVRVSSSDEIGVLENSFNTMGAEVARAQADLKTKIDQLNSEIMERKLVEGEREKLIAELQLAMSEIKTLQGIIPICATCKKIRDDQGSWKQLESYFREHSEAVFSHGICPECFEHLEDEMGQELPGGPE